jgi:TolB-like protein
MIFASVVSSSFAAEAPTLSVLYFTNLGSADASGDGRNYIGKALAEFSAAELSSIRGITIVERNTLEKLMKEMELSMTGIVDESSAPKIGKLLGAKYILDGSYLVSGKRCDVSFRIIDTEKGAVLKAGNLSGPTSDIGSLVRSLASSAGASLKEIFPGIDTSALASAKKNSVTIDSAERFGKALEMSDGGNSAAASELLRKLSAENPDSAVFRKALADLEKRIVQYDKAREEAIRNEEERPLTWNQFMKLSTAYSVSMQQTKLYNLCIRLRKNPPAVPEDYIIDASELIDYNIISALQSLKKFPETISEGETFLKKHPSSLYYQNVKVFMRIASDGLREAEANRKTITASIAAIERENANLGESFVNYRKGLEYYTKKFYPEAVSCFRKVKFSDIGKTGTTGDAILFYIFQCQAGIPDRTAAEKTLRTTETLFPDSQYLSGMKSQIDYIPE